VNDGVGGMSDGRPTGTVTFLFTDIEGSTRLWADDADAMSASLRLHDQLLREVIESHGGYIFTTAGDSFAAAFPRVSAAIDAAGEAQAMLNAADWAGGPPLRVRMGIHLGEAEERGGDYFGPAVNAAARVAAAGHGRQVLATAAAVSAVEVDGIDLGGHQLRDVVEPVHLYQLGPGNFPPLRTKSLGLVSIPSPRTSFIGREAAVIDIRKLVAEHQLVTLTGVGGCGKTRLAIEVAAREAPSRPDGVWFVDLATVADDDAVPGAIAAALDLVTNTSSPTADQIATYLAPRRALVVIDNCEHVLDEAADLVDAMLERAPQLRVLATSRKALEVEGEHTWRVPSLELGVDSAAVRLFVERADATADGFDPDRDTKAIIAEICQRLDGIPLAIELAAARARTMGVAEICDRLDDRFRLLSGGRRRSRQRQQTLEATVQWSYDLLSTDEKTMLDHLSVFQGGFDLADVHAIAAVGRTDALNLVDALVAKSLVDVTRTSGEMVRHRLLETVRLFALQRLVDEGVAETARDRHLDHFLSDRSVRDFGYHSQTAGGLRIQREMENLRAAAAWALERERPAATTVLATALVEQMMRRGELTQSRAWLQDVPELTVTERVQALVAIGQVCTESFDLAAGLAALTQAIEAAGEVPSRQTQYDLVTDGLPGAHCSAARIHLMTRRMDEVHRHIDLAMALSPRTPSPDANLAQTVLFRAAALAIAGDFDKAIMSAENALQAVSEVYVARVAIVDIRDLATFSAGGSPPPRPERPLRGTAGALRQPSDHVHDIVDALVSSRADGPDAAATRLAAGAGESVARRPNIIGDWLGGFALLAAERGDFDRARHLLDNSIAITLSTVRPAWRHASAPPGSPSSSRVANPVPWNSSSLGRWQINRGCWPRRSSAGPHRPGPCQLGWTATGHEDPLRRHRHAAARPPRVLRLPPLHDAQHRRRGRRWRALLERVRLRCALPAQPHGSGHRHIRHPQRGRQSRRGGRRPRVMGARAEILLPAGQRVAARGVDAGGLPHRLHLELPAAPQRPLVDLRIHGGHEPDRWVRAGTGRRGPPGSPRLAQPAGPGRLLVPARPSLGSAHPVQRARRLREPVRRRPDTGLAHRGGAGTQLAPPGPPFGPGTVGVLTRRMGRTTTTTALEPGVRR